MITALQLSKAFGPAHALTDVSLEVAQGEIYALLGRNGAGKTTLLNILTTLTRPDSGAARVAGFDVVVDALEVRRRIGVTFQEPLTERLLRGRDVLDLQGQLYGLSVATRRARIAEFAGLLEIEEVLDQPVKHHSGGMARRLELARSLMTCPQALFLDEPTSGLDPESREQFWRLLKRLRDAEGLTVLLTTHMLDEAEALADRVGILNGGALAVEGRPETLVAAVAGETVTVVGIGLVEPFLAALNACSWVAGTEIGTGGAMRLRAHLLQPGERARGPRVEIVVRLAGAAGSRLKPIIELGAEHGFAVEDVRLHRPGLDEVFQAHTGRRYQENGRES